MQNAAQKASACCAPQQSDAGKEFTYWCIFLCGAFFILSFKVSLFWPLGWSGSTGAQFLISSIELQHIPVGIKLIHLYLIFLVFVFIRIFPTVPQFWLLPTPFVNLGSIQTAVCHLVHLTGRSFMIVILLNCLAKWNFHHLKNWCMTAWHN